MRDIYTAEAQAIVATVTKARAQPGYATLTDGEKSAVLGALLSLVLRDQDCPTVKGPGQAEPTKL